MATIPLKITIDEAQLTAAANAAYETSGLKTAYAAVFNSWLNSVSALIASELPGCAADLCMKKFYSEIYEDIVITPTPVTGEYQVNATESDEIKDRITRSSLGAKVHDALIVLLNADLQAIVGLNDYLKTALARATRDAMKNVSLKLRGLK